MTNKTDSELVALARSGDKEAFGLLIERYQQMVKRIALDVVAQEEVARELAQEAILQAYLSLDHLRDNARFKRYCWRTLSSKQPPCRGQRTVGYESEQVESQQAKLLSSPH